MNNDSERTFIEVKKKRTFKRVLWDINKWIFKKAPKTYLVGIVVVGLLLADALSHYNVSNGHRSGYIRKFSHKGVLFKTWEGELDKRIAGGTFHPEDIFDFSCMSDMAAHKLDEAESTGKWVTVHYTQKPFHVFWRGETIYFVDDVTVSSK